MYVWRFTLYLVVDIDVSVDYFDLLFWFAYEPFDVVFLWVGRVFKHYNVSYLRFGELIEIFQDKYSVAFADPSRI